jgi:Zn-dependent M16 (insulinase) family peptidase
MFEKLIEKYMLNNNHKLRLVNVPNPKLGEKQQRVEALQLKALQKSLSKEEKESII